VIEDLRDAGIIVSIDDFGPGYFVGLSEGPGGSGTEVGSFVYQPSG